MEDFQSQAIRHQNGCLEILDQEQLPHQETWLKIEDYRQMIEAIQALKVRGAPLIGIAAALSLAKLAQSGCDFTAYQQAAQALRAARPTAVNLMWAIDAMLDVGDDFEPQAVIEKAMTLFQEDIALCEKIAINGAALIEDGDQIITHCNTGGIATVGIGTALGIIRYAHQSGKKIHVWVDESRPLLQGGRLTTWELEKHNIPYTLICDNMAAALMQQKKITKAFVGADRIAINGDFANKIGTYTLAITCHYHHIPFYVAAPYSTVDKACDSGAQIPIEQRPEKEVKGVQGAFGSCQWAPHNAPVENPAFDVTPHHLVSGWVLDKKVYSPKEIEHGVLAQPNFS